MHPAGSFFLLTALHMTYKSPEQGPKPTPAAWNHEPTTVIPPAQINIDQWLPGQVEDIAPDRSEPLVLNPTKDVVFAPEPTLRQVLLLHRHGDRTPYEMPDTSPLKNESFWTQHGLGQLTHRGKRRVYFMGKLARRRYGQFLNESVNKNQRFSQSSATPRCIESAQLFLAALLPLDSPDSPDAEALRWDKTAELALIWQPASIQVVPYAIDGMLAGGRCSEFELELNREMDWSTDLGQHIAREYKREIEMVKSYYQRDEFKSLNDLLNHLDSLMIEGSYFRSKLPAQYDDQFFERCQEMTSMIFALWQKTTKLRRLGHGLLMDDMVRRMDAFRNEHATGSSIDARKSETKRFIHYSAHDSTVTTILGMLGLWNDAKPQQPRFASNIALELHEGPTTEGNNTEWFVRIFYMQQVVRDEPPVEMHVPGCGSEHPESKCLLSKFTQLMRPYRVRSWQNWMAECGNDLETVNPYAEF